MAKIIIYTPVKVILGWIFDRYSFRTKRSPFTWFDPMRGVRGQLAHTPNSDFT